MKYCVRNSFLIVLIIFNSCSQKTTKIKEFEGVITYKITYENMPDSGVYVGDTLRIFYSSGNFIKEFNNKRGIGLRREYYFTKGNKYYMNLGKSDTLFSFDVSKTRNIILIKTNHLYNNDTILGYPCEKLEMAQLHAEASLNFYIYNSYLYSKNIMPINPEHFKDWHYGYFDKYVSESGNFYLRFTQSIQYYSQKELATKVYQAISIKEQKLDSILFKIDTLKIKEFSIP